MYCPFNTVATVTEFTPVLVWQNVGISSQVTSQLRSWNLPLYCGVQLPNLSLDAPSFVL